MDVKETLDPKRVWEERYKRTGFPEEWLPIIRAEMAQHREQFFVIPFETEIESKYVYGELGFYWNKKQGHHELDRMGVGLQQDAANLLDRKVFPLQEEIQISLTEAVNLLQGRQVFRGSDAFDGQPRWISLDLNPANDSNSVFHVRVSHWNLRDSIEELAATFTMTADQKRQLGASLEEGNLVEMENNLTGTFTRYWLRAHPDQQRIDVLDSKRERIDLVELAAKREKELTPEGQEQTHRKSR